MSKKFLAVVSLIRPVGGGRDEVDPEYGVRAPRGGRGEVDPGYGVDAPLLPLPPGHGGAAPSLPIAGEGGPSYPAFLPVKPGRGDGFTRPDNSLPDTPSTKPSPTPTPPGASTKPTPTPPGGSTKPGTLPSTRPGSGARPDQSLPGGPTVWPPLDEDEAAGYPEGQVWLLVHIPSVGWRYVKVDTGRRGSRRRPGAHPDNTLPDGGTDTDTAPDQTLPPTDPTAPSTQPVPPTPTDPGQQPVG